MVCRCVGIANERDLRVINSTCADMCFRCVMITASRVHGQAGRTTAAGAALTGALGRYLCCLHVAQGEDTRACTTVCSAQHALTCVSVAR